MNNDIQHLPNDDFKIVSNMDVCVLCGNITHEPMDKHISKRLYYIEGIGQMCIKCSESSE